MRPRPWLLLCVSLHGVAASVYGFPSWKHGLDYCIAEADTHHRHDSVDHHGTSNHMWDANAALLKAAYYLRAVEDYQSLAYPPRLAVDLGSYVDGEAHGWARQPYGYFDPAPRPRDIIHTYFLRRRPCLAHPVGG